MMNTGTPTRKPFQFLPLTAAAVAALALLSACGGGGAPNTPEATALDSAYMTKWQSDCQPIDEAPGNSGKVLQEITPSADGRLQESLHNLVRV